MLRTGRRVVWPHPESLQFIPYQVRSISTMLKLGRLTDYATVLMAALAGEPSGVVSAHELAQRTGLPQPTVGKILKLLGKGGLVIAQRGAQGGYRLARTPEAISFADIVAALEGPIALTECADGVSHCVLEKACGVRGNWRRISDAVTGALSAVTLAQLARADAPRPGSAPRT
jgi:transcriptional regulator, BadM/Rrf2 family